MSMPPYQQALDFELLSTLIGLREYLGKKYDWNEKRIFFLDPRIFLLNHCPGGLYHT